MVQPLKGQYIHPRPAVLPVRSPAHFLCKPSVFEGQPVRRNPLFHTEDLYTHQSHDLVNCFDRHSFNYFKACYEPLI